MANEDAFNAARSAMMLYNAYLKTVGQDIGMDRAIGLHTKMCEEMGAKQGKILKDQAGQKQLDAKAVASLINKIPESFGMESQLIEGTPEKVVFRIGRCPVYEAGQMLGMDAKIIESLCRAGPMRMMSASAKQFNPKLSFQIRKFRSSAQDSCEEGVVLQ